MAFSAGEVMLKTIRRLWAVILLPPTLIGIYMFPSDWSAAQTEEVSKPWKQALDVLTQENLIWTYALTMSVWAVWTQVIPYWRERKPRFPPRHAELLSELADALASAMDIALSLAKYSTPKGQEDARLVEWATAHENVRRINEQIRYDADTWKTVDDFRHTLALFITDECDSQDTGELRSTIYRMSGPLFLSLHAGKSINRKKFPLPGWVTDR